MREKIERYVLLPFSVGCVSESSIAVAVQQSRKSKADTNPNIDPISRANNKEVEEEIYYDESLSGESNKSSFRSLSLRKPNVSVGIHRLVKGFKNFSHYFVYKEEMEEVEMEIEIGLPTDVKHVTHIGWDGSASTNEEAIKGWENLIPPDFLSMPSAPWRRSFEFSMVAQLQPSDDHNAPIISVINNASSS